MADGNGVLARLLSLEVALTRIETLAVGSKFQQKSSHDFFGHGLAHGRPWPMAHGHGPMAEESRSCGRMLLTFYGN